MLFPLLLVSASLHLGNGQNSIDTPAGNIIVIDRAIDSLPALPAGTVFIKKVVGRSSAQIPNWREYFQFSLDDVKKKARDAHANIIEVTRYRNFRIIPFGARLYANLYTGNSACLQQLRAQQQQAAQAQRETLHGTCIVHVKNYADIPVSLYLDDSLVAASIARGRATVNSLARRNPGYTFVIGHNGTLSASSEGLAHKAGGSALTPGREYFFIIFFTPTVFKTKHRAFEHYVHYARASIYFREVSKNVFEWDY